MYNSCSTPITDLYGLETENPAIYIYTNSIAGLGIEMHTKWKRIPHAENNMNRIC